LWERFEAKPGLKFKDPVMIVSISTSIPQYKALYSQGRELASFLLKKLKFEEVGTIHSSALAPEVITREDGTVTLPSCTIYVHRGKRDLLLVAGDSSPMDGQYEFCESLLGFAKRAGVRELVSIGARWSEAPLSPVDAPELLGFGTDKAAVDELKKRGVKVIANEAAPFFASVIVGLAGAQGIRGYKLSVDHGEPSPHPIGIGKMLRVLSEMFDFEVDLSDLRVKQEKAAPPPRSDPTSIYH
jgi:proteasome assembly chaperone (PAC2) family protein